jgi:hypothetical protein
VFVDFLRNVTEGEVITFWDILAVLVDKLLQAPYIFGSTHRGAARYINDPREFFLQIFIKIKKSGK